MDRPDEFFEYLLNRRAEPLELLGIPFEPSAVALSDPAAYMECKSSLFTESEFRIQEALAGESWDRLRTLQALMSQRRVTPFVGAGMSVAAGLPTWSGFLTDMARPRLDPSELDPLLEGRRYDELADLLVERFGEPLFDERVSVFEGGQPSVVHGLLPRIFKGTAFTTNFDGLVEAAYSAAGVPFDVTVYNGSQWHGASAADTQGSRVLVKVHGDCRFSDSRVFTRAEYDAAYAAGGPLRRDLEALFINDVVVFLGCSLYQDRVMDVAHEVALERVGHRAAITRYSLYPRTELAPVRNERAS